MSQLFDHYLPRIAPKVNYCYDQIQLRLGVAYQVKGTVLLDGLRVRAFWEVLMMFNVAYLKVKAIISTEYEKNCYYDLFNSLVCRRMQCIYSVDLSECLMGIQMLLLSVMRVHFRHRSSYYCRKKPGTPTDFNSPFRPSPHGSQKNQCRLCRIGCLSHMKSKVLLFDGITNAILLAMFKLILPKAYLSWLILLCIWYNGVYNGNSSPFFLYIASLNTNAGAQNLVELSALPKKKTTSVYKDVQFRFLGFCCWDWSL